MVTQPGGATVTYVLDTQDIATADVDELLGHLRDVALALVRTTAEVEGLYALRLAIYQEARRRVPKVSQRALAKASGLSDVQVLRVLRKADEATTNPRSKP